MHETQEGNGLFSLGTDFDIEFWEIVSARRKSDKEECPEDSADRLLDDYLWLRKYLIQRVVANKNPTTLLDRHNHPLIKDVCALQHIDREEAWNIAQEVDKIADSEDTYEALSLLKEKVKALYNGPKPTFFYRMCPNDYFVLYDIPQLMYLYARHKQHPGVHTIRATDCPDCFQAVLEKTSHKKREFARFGVAIHIPPNIKEMSSITIPYFCENGRLEAFQRFITHGGRATRVHQFSYFTRLLPTREKLESVSPFNDEDAWYFEICTGLSLVTEITALLLELGVDISDISSNDNARSSWSGCRLGIIGKLLHNHRESIIKCPAIYWRVACLRNAIRQTDYQCRMKELKYEQQINLAYAAEMPEDHPQTVGDWLAFAKEQFEQYFYTDLDMIGIRRDAFLYQQFSKNANIKFQESSLPELPDPDNSEFMTAARELGIQLLNGGLLPDRVTDAVMKTAIFDSEKSCCPDTNFYFRGCLHRNDANVKKLITPAIIKLQNVHNDNSYEVPLEKLRNTNRDEMIFEFIHNSLYGSNSAEYLGFR